MCVCACRCMRELVLLFHWTIKYIYEKRLLRRVQLKAFTKSNFQKWHKFNSMNTSYSCTTSCPMLPSRHLSILDNTLISILPSLINVYSRFFEYHINSFFFSFSFVFKMSLKCFFFSHVGTSFSAILLESYQNAIIDIYIFMQVQRGMVSYESIAIGCFY